MNQESGAGNEPIICTIHDSGKCAYEGNIILLSLTQPVVYVFGNVDYSVLSPCLSLPSVVWPLPVWNMVVGAVLQYEPGRESGSDPGHGAPAVLRLEDDPDHVRHFLCLLLLCLSGVCKEWAKGRGPSQHPARSQEGGEGRYAMKSGAG